MSFSWTTLLELIMNRTIGRGQPAGDSGVESRVLERVMTQTVNRIKERPVEDKRIDRTHEPLVTCITRNKPGKRHKYG